MKAVQKFSKEYLEQCKDLTPEQTIKFLEDFRSLQASTKKSKTKLISLKVPENLLEAFKFKSEVSGLRYQTQIKNLMKEWLAKK